MAPDYTTPTCTRTIDGLTYTSDKFPALQAVALKARCVTAAGPNGMRAIVQRHARGFADVAPALVLDATDVNVYGAMAQLSYGVQQDPELVRDLCALLRVDKLRPANVGGGKVAPNFDMHFAGELPHMFRVLEFVAVHNFLGFTLGPRFPVGSDSSDASETAASSD